MLISEERIERTEVLEGVVHGRLLVLTCTHVAEDLHSSIQEVGLELLDLFGSHGLSSVHDQSTEYLVFTVSFSVGEDLLQGPIDRTKTVNFLDVFLKRCSRHFFLKEAFH